MDITLDLKQQERDFIQACINQERWAQKKLYEDHYGSLVAVCMRYSKDHDEALDILHEGYIKIFKNLHKYKPGTSLYSWMKRIMVNSSIDYFGLPIDPVLVVGF